MFYNKQIKILQTSAGNVDDDGIFHDGEDITLKTIDCDVQPTSRERLFRLYGWDEEVKFRVFSDINSNINNGVRVKYKDDNYKVIKVIEWDDYLEFFIDNI